MSRYTTLTMEVICEKPEHEVSIAEDAAVSEALQAAHEALRDNLPDDFHLEARQI